MRVLTSLQQAHVCDRGHADWSLKPRAPTPSPSCWPASPGSRSCPPQQPIGFLNPPPKITYLPPTCWPGENAPLTVQTPLSWGPWGTPG